MSVKLVVCATCGEKVSKRSTLSLEELGLGAGRACRKHEIVVKGVKDRDREDSEKCQVEKQAKLMREVDEKMRIMSAAAGVRVAHTIRGIDPELLYLRLESFGDFTEGMVQDVRAEVDRLGGPNMSEAEVSDAVASAAELILGNHPALDR